MRKLCIILMAATPLMIVMAGCSGQVDIPVGGIDSVRVDNVVENYCNSFDPCSYTYWISFQDPEQGDHYYWAELASRTDTAKGKTVEMYNNGWDWHSINVTAYYFEVTPYEYYYVNVYRTNSPLYGGIVAKRTSAGMLLGSPMQMGPFATDCGTTCCTENYAWAGIAKFNPTGANLVGAKANITTRYPEELCGQTTDATYSHSVVWVAVVYDTSAGYHGSIWAASGYGKWRFEGFNEVFKARFLEMQGVGDATYYKRVDINNPNIPPDDEVHEFKTELNPETYRWLAFYDNQIYDSATYDPIWQSVLGSYSRFSGEIFNFEDDMAGTADHKCRIAQCSTKSLGGSYGFVDFSLYSEFWYSDTTEWMVRIVNSHTIDIWDVKPRP
jgi:hypothetical protein